VTDERAWTFCQICRAECGMIAHLRNGVVVRVEGDRDDSWSQGGLCVKGRNAPHVLYAEDRLRHPLIRSERKNGFRQVSWQQAIDFIGDKMESIAAKYGPQAVACYQGTTARVLDDMLLRRLARLFGTPNVTGTWSVCVGPKILAYTHTFGRPPMPWCDLRNSRYIILWGTNPPVTHLHRHRGITADIVRARKQGAKLVVIDPRRTPIAAHADAHLPVRPGTDLALALAMISHIVRNDLYDKEFVEAYTHGFEELAAHVVPYTPAWAEGITDVPADTIEDVATGFATTKPASLERRQGVQRGRTSTQTLRAMAILMAITGNVDIQGGLMLTPYRRLSSLPLPEGLPPLPETFWARRFPLARDASAYLPEAILSAKPYPLRGLIVVEGNPLSCFPNTGKVLRALDKLDLLVTHELFMTDTAQLSDVVLPACTFFEKGEISVQSLRRDYPVRARLPVVEPLYEAMPEWRFYSLLANRLGHGQFFPFTSDDELIDAVLSRAGWTNHEAAVATRFGNVLENGFTTPTGRIELYSQSLQECGHDALPTPPSAWPDDAGYPYYLITGARVPHYYHSQHRNIAALRRAHPQPVAEVSQALAAELGLANGEEVKIETPVGAAIFRAKVSQGLHSLTVSIPHGWGGGLNANWLVDDLACDPLAGTPPYGDMRCRLERV
jgi:anaerobic selenocysteine-containing dehydrogenase